MFSCNGIAIKEFSQSEENPVATGEYVVEAWVQMPTATGIASVIPSSPRHLVEQCIILL